MWYSISLILSACAFLQPMFAEAEIPLYFPTSDASWATTNAAAAGADPALLAEAVAHAQSTHTDALVILHAGQILTESYWNGTSRLTKKPIFSATKPMTAALIGILIENGTIDSVDQKSADFLPEWRGVPGKSEITIRHHLSMTTGLAGGEIYLALSTRASNERTFAINLPMDYTPGAYWTYNNPAYRLLFSIISSATGSSLSAVFQQYIADPLGMSGCQWIIRKTQVDGQSIDNYQFLACNALSAARFGLLAQAGGLWNGQQVTPAQFFTRSIAPSQTLNPSYGFLWWLNIGASNGGHQQLFDGVARQGPYFPDAPPDLFAAIGKDDQLVAVIPSLDLVIVRLGTDPLGTGSEAISFEQNLFLAKIARAFGYSGQTQPFVLRIAAVPTHLSLDLPTWFGRTYQIETSTALGSNIVWQPAHPTPFPGNGLPLHIDWPLNPNPAAFFRGLIWP